MPEAFSGIIHADAEPIVDYVYALNRIEAVAIQANLDVRGVGIDAVPDQFGNPEDWLLRLRKGIDVILCNLDVENLHILGVGMPRGTIILDVINASMWKTTARREVAERALAS